MADDILPTEIPQRLQWWLVAIEGHVAESLMRSEPMVVRKPLSEKTPQVSLPEHDEVIEDLVLRALYPGFGKGIEIRRTRWDRPELDAVRLDDRAELGGELAVPVADGRRRSSTASTSVPSH
jgi:hypothetical protein